ncbi:MAG: rRNA maturation RNase YbeY [Bacteroidales bacterium]|nr:rRNA maturation RNase YbeY [Bacteroidales bacterium]
MISFEFQTACDFVPTIEHKQWLKAVIRKEQLIPGDILYLFCDDAYLLERNIQFLNHHTLTDIITFDQRVGNVVSGNIMISLDRVEENAQKFAVSFEEELLRVIVHGTLHICGYKDKSPEEAVVMRSMENVSLEMFHDKQFCK